MAMVDEKIDSTLFIHAVSVHQGGGARLLNALLSVINPHRRIVLNVDRRMSLPATLPASLEVRRIKKSIVARLFAEVWLCNQATKNDCVLCFGNLPPLFPVKAFTSVFVQNRYLVDRVGLNGVKTWPRLRIKFERLWLRQTIHHANQYLVQTPSMQRLVSALVKDSVPVVIAPFSQISKAVISRRTEKPIDVLPKFVYVASGEEHKNHRRLIEAWSLLAADGIRPQLYLTIDKEVFAELCLWISEQATAHDLKVHNLGTVDAATIASVYDRTDALIYPSLLESFGLPLIEASAAGLAVLAAELDYVWDVARPVQTFDPSSALSIFRAVKRFCGYQDPDMRVLSPAEFLRISNQPCKTA